jgi:hypothetical protein
VNHGFKKHETKQALKVFPNVSVGVSLDDTSWFYFITSSPLILNSSAVSKFNHKSLTAI